MKLTFLEAAVPLTKRYTVSKSGELQKSNYPMVKNFTSHIEEVDTLVEFHKVLVKHAELNHCLLKGNVNTPLENQPRAGSTSPTAKTQFITLDYDGADYESVESALAAININGESVFDDVSYIVQYSASHGMPGSTGLRCHVFFMLDEERSAPFLKSWLMYLNLKCESLRAGIKLTSANSALSWPLDITVCQNDKLIFIAPPTLSGIKNPIKQRIQYIAKKLQVLPVDRIASVDHDAMRSAAHQLKNELRVAAGLDKMRATNKYENGYYIINNPNRAEITSELRVTNGYVNFNVNGGDSWSYGHPVDNWDLIYCFKHMDEPLVTKKFLPEYWLEKEAERKALNAAPTEEGDILLGFSDFKSSTYWRGKWNPNKHKLDIVQVGSPAYINDWYVEHGRDPLEFIPTWNIMFDPTNPVVVDPVKKLINTYVPNHFMRNIYEPNPKAKYTKCPTIIKTMLHVLNFEENSTEFEHWLNWLAVIYQKRIKTQTAWVLSGTEGTGKGTLGNMIIAPTLGAEYVASRMGNSLEEIYNGWMERCLVAVLDEVDLAASEKKNIIHQNMKKYITDSPMPYRYMHRMQYENPSFINFILCTNSKESVHITEGNRRYNIAKYQPEKINYTQKDIAQITKELPYWVEYVMTRPADVDKAAQIIKTEAHAHLVEVSRTSVDDVATRLIRGDISYFLDFMPDLELQAEVRGLTNGVAEHYAGIIKRELTKIKVEGARVTSEVKLSLSKRGIKVDESWTSLRSKLTREEVHTIFEYTVGNMPTTPAKFTQFLRHRGIDIEPLKVNETLVRGLYVQWVVNPEQLTEINNWIAHNEKPASGKVVPLRAKVN